MRNLYPRHSQDIGQRRYPVHHDEWSRHHGVVAALDSGLRSVGKWMAYKGRIYSTISIELFFKGKDNQGLRNIFPQQLYPPLPPRPELRTNVVDDGNSAFMHLAGYAPVK